MIDIECVKKKSLNVSVSFVKLLKNKDDGTGNPDDALRRREQPERISKIVRDITKALIIHAKDKKQF